MNETNTKDGVLPSHVEQTIQELRALAQEYLSVAHSLERTFAGRSGAPPAAPSITRSAQPATVKRASKGGARKGTDEQIAALAQLAQPLTARQVAAALKMESKSAAQILARWQRKGWLHRVANGHYERTEGLGGLTPERVTQRGHQMLSEIKQEIAEAQANGGRR